ncbi:leukocyte-associated immunoglobulin-like receptor 1 [Pteronotus mesoamericanus]|uniref:leukocyte-associated immunoglobulin-like receptor 1 n=1 Tax=Pteronotus mesoamericanus TaxID=1884717 RepID=UPI0023EAF4F9|nr:leukocyte-associated immunoglobulin-like receptor 1 [Pteronotus parnellii mesoamericanus]
MGSHPNPLLVLVLCLAPAVHLGDGAPPAPSIGAEPGPVIRRGQPVTIVCRGPAGADLFRLVEKENLSAYWDQEISSPHGSQGTEARFRIPAVNEDTAGTYHCLYHKVTNSSQWSAHSDPLELQVTDEDVSTPPSAPACDARPPDSSLLGDTRTNSQDSNKSSLSTEHIYILVGISVAFALCLLFLVLLLVHQQRQKKRGPPGSKGKEPAPQERRSPTADVIESTADVAAADTVPEKNRDTHSPSPAAGDPQEVTYAQLDQWALTRRAAQDASPPTMEPTGDSSMYAALPRR